jgi:hypothetical protein
VRSWAGRFLQVLPWLGLAATGTAVALIGFTLWLVPAVLGRQLIHHLGADGRARVEIGSVEYHFPLSATVSDLRVYPPGWPDGPPVLVIGRAAVGLAEIPGPWSDKVRLETVELSDWHLTTAERPDGTETLAAWVEAMRAALAEHHTSPETAGGLDEYLSIRRLELRDGAVGKLVPGRSGAVGVENIRLLLENTARTGDGRYYYWQLDTNVGPLGPVAVAGMLDARDLVLQLDKPAVDLVLDERTKKRLPAELQALLKPFEPGARVTISDGLATIPLASPEAARYRFSARVRDGRTRLPGVDLALESVDARIAADSQTPWRIEAEARAAGEPVRLRAQVAPRSGTGRFELSLNDAATLTARGRRNAATGGIEFGELAARADLSSGVVRRALDKWLGPAGVANLAGTLRAEGTLTATPGGGITAVRLTVAAEQASADVAAAGAEVRGLTGRAEVGWQAGRPPTVRGSVDAGSVNLPAVPLRVDGLSARAVWDPAGAADLSLAGKVAGQSLELRGRVPLGGPGDWRATLRQNDRLAIWASGRYEPSTGRLTAPTLGADLDDIRPVSALLPPKWREAVSAYKTEGGLTAEGSLSVDLSAGRLEAAELSWQLRGVAFDAGPEWGPVRIASAAGRLARQPAADGPTGAEQLLLTVEELSADTRCGRLEGSAAVRTALPAGPQSVLEIASLQATLRRDAAAAATDLRVEVSGRVDLGRERLSLTIAPSRLALTPGECPLFPAGVRRVLEPFLLAGDLRVEGRLGADWSGARPALTDDTRLELRFTDARVSPRPGAADDPQTAWRLFAAATLVGTRDGPAIRGFRMFLRPPIGDGPDPESVIIVRGEAAYRPATDALQAHLTAEADVSTALLRLAGLSPNGERRPTDPGGRLRMNVDVSAGLAPPRLDLVTARVRLSEVRVPTDADGAGLYGLGGTLEARFRPPGDLTLRVNDLAADFRLPRAPEADRKRLHVAGGDLSARFALDPDAGTVRPVTLSGRFAESPLGALTLEGVAMPSEDRFRVTLAGARLTYDSDAARLLVPADLAEKLAAAGLGLDLPLAASVRLPARWPPPPDAPARLPTLLIVGGDPVAPSGGLIERLSLQVAYDPDTGTVAVKDLSARLLGGGITGEIAAELRGAPAVGGRLKIDGVGLPEALLKDDGDIRALRVWADAAFVAPLGASPTAEPIAQIRNARLQIRHSDAGVEPGRTRTFTVEDIAFDAGPARDGGWRLAGSALGPGGRWQLSARVDPEARLWKAALTGENLDVTADAVGDIPIAGPYVYQNFRAAGRLDAGVRFWGRWGGRSGGAEGRVALRFRDVRGRLWAESLPLTGLSGTMEIDLPDLGSGRIELTFRDAKAGLHGGTLRTETPLTLARGAKTEGGPVRYTGSLAAEGVSLKQLYEGLHPDGDRELSGTLRGRAHLSGDGRGLDGLSVRGGFVELQDGRLYGIPLFAELSAVLSTVLTFTPFRGAVNQDARFSFTFRDRVLDIESAQVRDPLLRTEFHGTVGFVPDEGGASLGYRKPLNLTVRAYPLGQLSDVPILNLLGGALRVVGRNLPLHVRGTTDDPQVGLGK